MKPEKKALLMKIFDEVADRQRAKVDPREIILHLVDQHGATFRYNAGADVLRCAGIVGQSTSGPQLVLDSWKRAVTTAIVKANQGGFGSET